MEFLHTEKAPAAIGPYAQAVRTGDFVFTSGQLGIDPATGELAPDTAGQTTQALENLRAVLQSAGLDLKNVVKTTCYLKDMGDFALFNEIYARYFGDHTPARCCFAVAQLPKDGLVEMEAIAVK